jgi:hypothetical protein
VGHRDLPEVIWQLGIALDTEIVAGIFNKINMANYRTTRMRLYLSALGMALIFIFTFHPLSHAQEGDWRIDPLHSAAHFSVRHMMISTVRGEFTGVTGSVTYDPKQKSRSQPHSHIFPSAPNDQRRFPYTNAGPWSRWPACD